MQNSNIKAAMEYVITNIKHAIGGLVSDSHPCRVTYEQLLSFPLPLQTFRFPITQYVE